MSLKNGTRDPPTILGTVSGLTLKKDPNSPSIYDIGELLGISYTIIEEKRKIRIDSIDQYYDMQSYAQNENQNILQKTVPPLPKKNLLGYSNMISKPSEDTLIDTRIRPGSFIVGCGQVTNRKGGGAQEILQSILLEQDNGISQSGNGGPNNSSVQQASGSEFGPTTKSQVEVVGFELYIEKPSFEAKLIRMRNNFNNQDNQNQSLTEVSTSISYNQQVSKSDSKDSTHSELQQVHDYIPSLYNYKGLGPDKFGGRIVPDRGSNTLLISYIVEKIEEEVPKEGRHPREIQILGDLPGMAAQYNREITASQTKKIKEFYEKTKKLNIGSLGLESSEISNNHVHESESFPVSQLGPYSAYKGVLSRDEYVDLYLDRRLTLGCRIVGINGIWRNNDMMIKELIHADECVLTVVGDTRPPEYQNRR